MESSCVHTSTDPMSEQLVANTAVQAAGPVFFAELLRQELRRARYLRTAQSDGGHSR